MKTSLATLGPWLLPCVLAFAAPQKKDAPLIYVIMAVSSLGKSTQGEKLAKQLGVPFYEPDEYHSESNRKKISAGQALTDEDRGPWLDRIRQEVIEKHLREGKGAVVACSALKRKYRQRLGLPHSRIQLVYLKGTLEMALANNRKRQGHFAPEATVSNNFAVLEEPSPDENAVVIEVESLGIEATFNRLVRALHLRSSASS
ncbi:MAG: gluconokinase [Deltaproteobacteria bacterium]|nr:gluconokinase [Deltaproteobacteria bacterium]MBI3296094.1 gluconokinase [Deltaproteobacteria bacterium]